MHQHCYSKTERLCVQTHTYGHTKHRHLFLNKPPGRGRLAQGAQQSGRWRREPADARVAKAPAWCFHPREEAPFCRSLIHTKRGGTHRGANGDGENTNKIKWGEEVCLLSLSHQSASLSFVQRCAIRLTGALSPEIYHNPCQPTLKVKEQNKRHPHRDTFNILR